MNFKSLVPSLELCRPIAHYEGLYEVDSDGNVFSLPKRGWHKRTKLVPLKTSGYYAVRLLKNNQAKTFKVHRLVASAFIPNPKKKPWINHKNNKRDDNRVENLEWCTPGENQKHAYKIGSKTSLGVKNSKAVFTEREVKFLRYIKEQYPSLMPGKISKFYGVSSNAVCDIWLRKKWKHI